MSKTNCVNCGAAKDIDAVKCPFCGTTYLDMTAIDFTSKNPVACQFLMNDGSSGEKFLMTMLAVPRLESIQQTTDEVSFYGHGYPLYTYTSSRNIDIGITFTPVEKSGTLFEIKKHEQESIL